MKTRIAIIAAAALMCAPITTMAQEESLAHSIIGHTNNLVKDLLDMAGTSHQSEDEIMPINDYENNIEYDWEVNLFTKDEEFGHMPGMYIGPNFLMEPGTLTSQSVMPMRDGRGFELGFGLWQNGFAFNKGQNVGVVYGLSIARSRYKLKNNNYLDWNNGSLTLYNAQDADKTIMRYWTLQVPVLFEICAHNGKDLFVNFGVQGEYHFGEMSKIKWGKHDKEKVTHDLNLNPFGASAVAQLGIGEDLAIYARYSLTNLFKDDSPIETTPFTVGLSFGF